MTKQSPPRPARDVPMNSPPGIANASRAAILDGATGAAEREFIYRAFYLRAKREKETNTPYWQRSHHKCAQSTVCLLLHPDPTYPTRAGSRSHPPHNKKKGPIMSAAILHPSFRLSKPAVRSWRGRLESVHGGVLSADGGRANRQAINRPGGARAPCSPPCFESLTLP